MNILLYIFPARWTFLNYKEPIIRQLYESEFFVLNSFIIDSVWMC